MPCAQLKDWADAMVVAPMSANTLGKLASGLADNLLVRWTLTTGKGGFRLLIDLSWSVDMHGARVDHVQAVPVRASDEHRHVESPTDGEALGRAGRAWLQDDPSRGEEACMRRRGCVE